MRICAWACAGFHPGFRHRFHVHGLMPKVLPCPRCDSWVASFLTRIPTTVLCIMHADCLAQKKRGTQYPFSCGAGSKSLSTTLIRCLLERITHGYGKHRGLELDVGGPLYTQRVGGDLGLHLRGYQCCGQRPLVVEAVSHAALQGQADRIFQ